MCSKPSYFLLLFLDRIVEIKQRGHCLMFLFIFGLYMSPLIYIYDEAGHFFGWGSIHHVLGLFSIPNQIEQNMNKHRTK